jgi:hypothetical protein
MSLSPTDRDRLVKLLGMTGSNAEGEAINAMRLANRTLGRLQLTWDDVIGTSGWQPEHRASTPENWSEPYEPEAPSSRARASTSRHSPPPPRPEAQPRTTSNSYYGTGPFGTSPPHSDPDAQPFWVICDLLLGKFAHELTEWESGFIEGIRRRKWPLSPKQSATLERILERVLPGVI